MSVSIHWAFRSDASSPDAARGLVERLRGHALTLPFQEVGEVFELEGDAANFHLVPNEHPHNWLLCQALGRYRRGGQFFEVPPTHVIAFETMPGPGCAQANFGLCRYPPHLDADGNPEPDPEDEPSLPPFPSSLSGWRWLSSCKTHFASNPACGGLANFVRCHVAVISMLDQAKSLGLLADLSDEGEYWTRRDPVALARRVAGVNEDLAAFVGAFQDLVGEGVRSPITGFPNFEPLEARGADPARRSPPE